MTSRNLENLVQSGQLKRETGDRREFEGLLRSAQARLSDARLPALSVESRFDLAYNAAHALALAALRWNGYRSDSRYIVFQCLPHTLGSGQRCGEYWRFVIRGAIEGNTRGAWKLTSSW